MIEINARFRVEAVVGRGSFGRVLRVVDRVSGEPFAMKLVTGAASEAMLLDEYAQLARLAHPALPRVFEIGRTDAPITLPDELIAAGAPFFVAQWIAGPRCDATAWRGSPIALLADICGALATIHAAGLVHGDVAPQNLMFATAERASHVLVDLGLATVTGVRGTPAYMAPEAFAGTVEPRSDLYGLAASIVRLVDGAPLYDAPTLGELVQRIAIGGARPRLAGVPAPLVDLLGRMLARDPAARPASAIAVLAELATISPALGLATRAPVGNLADAAIDALALAAWPGARALVDATAAASSRGAIVVGTIASGAHAIVDAAVRVVQLARVARGAQALPVCRGALDELVPGARAPAAALGALDGLVVVELGDDPRAAGLLANLARPDTIVVVDDAVLGIRVPRLDRAALGELAARVFGEVPSDVWLDGLARAGDGLALTSLELLRGAARERAPLAVDWGARSSAGAERLETRRLAAVSEPARSIALAVAIWGGRARLDRALAAARALGGDVGLAEVAELERAGLVRRRGDALVADRATCAAAIAAASDRARRLAEVVVAGAVGVELELAPVLAHATIAGPTAALACAIATALLDGGRADRALAVAQLAIVAEPARAGLIAARAAAAVGSRAETTRLATAAIAAGADPAIAHLAIARAAQRAGELDDAEAILVELPRSAEVAGVLARLLVTRARFAEARAIALAGDAPLAGLRAEAAGLAAFYLGALDDADRAFAALELGALATGDSGLTGRALSLRGMVAQQRGQLGLAGDRYAEAARRLTEVGAHHAAASAELNLGTVLAERGRASEALPRLAAAERVFAELGATTELCAAELNRGNACIAVGQLVDALAAATSAIARAAAVPHLHAFALLVAGDARDALGDRPAALAAYREALAIAVARDDAHAQLAAHVALAEAGVAPASLDAVAAMAASDDDRDRWTLAHARLVVDTADRALAASIARACAAVGARADRADRLARAVRAHALAARHALRADDRATAETETAAARAAHAAMLAAAAPAFRAAMQADRDLDVLPTPDVARRDPDQLPLRRLLVLSRRLNSEASLARILDEVIDTAIELATAERGFLLLREPGGELRAVVSRNFDTGELEPGTAHVSRSIAERAAQTGEPVVTVDAGVDERFGAAASVAALRLRSVLAVPLRQRGAITGCIYLDHRLQRGAFDDRAATVVSELADVAAIAIENARLADELRTTTRALDTLNARLAADLAERDAELVRVKADLPDRDRLRHRYERIIGRSPAMVRVLGLVDRAASTALPIVIVGESGTGKELVARALHDNGPRASAAFVALNCSAVPESLLESELFGHVRGAFTGADRDRRGLFEVADGGTLFLDEIAEMSLGMQAKLLRVLQDGLVRRVGDSKTKKVDVRVVAASQHPLATLAEAGRFREDLRYRLEVIAIPIPPLRDRDGDIPLLVDALLAAICVGKSTPKLTRAALRALAQHRWPGNVRELDNALARGVAMGGDVIDVADLPDAITRAPAVGASTTAPALDRDADLRLKPALLATETAYLGAAMTRAKNNQTVAARLLGISRFGLQKKLRRLAGDPVEDDED